MIHSYIASIQPDSCFKLDYPFYPCTMYFQVLSSSMANEIPNFILMSSQVNFEPPRLALGKDLELPIGPQSSVILTTTYLTPEARLGKGSRGSLFVFTKGGPSDSASGISAISASPCQLPSRKSMQHTPESYCVFLHAKRLVQKDTMCKCCQYEGLEGHISCIWPISLLCFNPQKSAMFCCII